MKALVVDDSKVARKMLSGMLTQHCDFTEIVEAEDGAEAVGSVQQEDFDLILLDWELPKMSGIDVLRKIREWGKTTPVLMVTGESDKERVLEAYEAGANNYIFKPYQPASLAEKILRIFDGFLEADAETETTLGKALVVDDSSVGRRVLVGILHHNVGFEEILQASDGAEAVEMVKRDDFDVVLMDWNMPNMSGIDALKQIRWLGKKMPIVMVTSEAEKDRVVEALENGANDYIVKPFTTTSIETKIKKILRIQ